MNKRCLLTASQASKQRLVPFAEWKGQTNPILEEEVGQKYVSQNSTTYRHNIFKQITLWALLMRKRFRTSENTGKSADSSFCLDYPWHSVAFPPEIKTFMPVYKISSKQIIQHNSLPSFDHSSLRCYWVTKYILGIKKAQNVTSQHKQSLYSRHKFPLDSNTESLPSLLISAATISIYTYFHLCWLLVSESWQCKFLMQHNFSVSMNTEYENYGLNIQLQGLLLTKH